jgi:hypothetical protein
VKVCHFVFRFLNNFREEGGKTYKLKGKFKRENASETSSNCANKDGLTKNKHTNEKEDEWMELKVGRWTEIKCPFPLTGRNVGSVNCF